MIDWVGRTMEGTEKCSEQICLQTVLNVHNLSLASAFDPGASGLRDNVVYCKTNVKINNDLRASLLLHLHLCLFLLYLAR
jgi:hypothetical protein